MSRKYKKFNYPNAVTGSKTLLTGIRNVECEKKQFFICGFYEPPSTNSNEQVKSFVYKGTIKGKGEWYELYYPGSNVTNLYGPANDGQGGIQIVGNYTMFDSKNTIGCLYKGPLDGSGKWNQIIPPFGEVKNVIVHSNMKNLAVGNYDTGIAGKAFIYDIKTEQYFEIVKKDAISITAYGIWYNGCGSYTICGSYKPSSLLSHDIAYTVDWDNNKKKFSNWKTYQYSNYSITHFDGISGTKHGYSLTGDAVKIKDVEEIEEVAFYFLTNKKGKDKKWEEIEFPNSIGTSGNSVYKDIVIGVYKDIDESSINGYVSKICKK